MSQQITWNFGFIRENPFYSTNFQLNFSFGAKFDSEISKILWWTISYNLQLITFPKSYLSLKSTHGDWWYLRLFVKKRVQFESWNPKGAATMTNQRKKTKFSIFFFFVFFVFSFFWQRVFLKRLHFFQSSFPLIFLIDF
jgi:hypothetical protein